MQYDELVFNLIFHATTISGLHVDSSFGCVLSIILAHRVTDEELQRRLILARIDAYFRWLWIRNSEC
jgi:hypothetical protein